jgi:hypothetical protein
MEFDMITFFWLFTAAMLVSSSALIALTIADVFDAHKDSQAVKRLRRLTQRACYAFGSAGGVLRKHIWSSLATKRNRPTPVRRLFWGSL